MNIRALIFDFNGVIVDDEPVHYRLCAKTIADEGIELKKEDYYHKYLGFDDKECFKSILIDHQKNVSDEMIQKLIEKKSLYYYQVLKEADLFVEGVVDFIKQNAASYYFAVVSGALQNEIMTWLDKAKIKDLFHVIVAAEHVVHSKPHPEGYLRALDEINLNYIASDDIILPNECLVFEDSPWGIQSASDAGMQVMALSTSYPASSFNNVLKVIPHFKDFDLKTVLKPN